MDEIADNRAVKGRGAVSNRVGRFESYRYQPTDDGWKADDVLADPATTVFIDHSRGIIARNESPDLPFEQSINPYRGCEHGCIYCYARPTHAYLGLSPGIDFETKIAIKPNAAALLTEAINRPKYRCKLIAMGTNTDPYQPLERQHCITRGLLEVLAANRHPVTFTTKSSLIERDIDLLAPMAERNLVQVFVSITTLDPDLSRRMEPRTAAPRRRLRTIRRLIDAGIPTGVLVAPIIPVLTDPELESIVEACAAAGAVKAGYVLLRLPHEVKSLFKEWLQEHVPLKAERVMARVRDTRGGRENDAKFGRRMRGAGEYANLIAQRFRIASKRFGVDRPMPELDTAQFTKGTADRTQLLLL
ncbi:MAG: PA0069 family radical SAM protein [Gammaproteobacteria bacterium]|nr:PA0069 family radical SAM protein [Gammaproteobacteria bacterium]